MKIRCVTALIFAICGMLCIFPPLRAQIITTFAGNGVFGYSGDNGPAANANLEDPAGLVVDDQGNLYFTDFAASCIRKINKQGTISTIAGTTGIFSGPNGLAIDTAGNLYVADTYNSCVRKLDKHGSMTIVAGIAGSLGFSGDGGQAIKAQLATPQGLAVDMAGNLYVADNFNECIRKVDKNGIITTIAGIKGQSGFSGDGGLATNAHVNYPAAVATDKTGNVYIVDCGNSCIRKIDKNGIITTVAGIGGSSGFSGDGGPANEAQLNLPLGITLDSTGNLFIADNQNSVIRKIDQNGIISTYAGGLPYYSGDGGPAVGSGISLYATFDCISGLALDASGNLYIADMGDKRIREVIKQALPLPLTLISFTGEIEHGRSILTWETADEINTKTFTVERSTDGINFLTLGTVAAIDEPGHHTYNHIDASPLQGNNYYRLKMIDKDGSFSYSNLITINKGNIQFAITVLPNPVTNDVTLQISTPLKGRYAVTITSTGGEPVKHIVGIALVGNNIIHIKTTDLAAGVYIVSYTDGSGLHSTKLVKE